MTILESLPVVSQKKIDLSLASIQEQISVIEQRKPPPRFDPTDINNRLEALEMQPIKQAAQGLNSKQIEASLKAIQLNSKFDPTPIYNKISEVDNQLSAFTIRIIEKIN